MFQREVFPASSKEFLDIQTTIECVITLKRVRDMTKTYSQMHRTDKYSQHNSIIWLVWLNDWVYELSSCEFESSCTHQKDMIWLNLKEEFLKELKNNETNLNNQIFK